MIVSGVERKSMNYTEATDYMEEMKARGNVWEAKHMGELCRRLGNPQKQLPFVYVAGTNGKSSVLSYIAGVLKCAGYKVGSYLLPAIFGCREGIQVNGRPITKQGLCDCLWQVREAAEQMKEAGLSSPPFYEIEMAAAFLYFKQQECRLVIMEAGGGDRQTVEGVIDKPVIVVFAPVSMDNEWFSEKTPGKTAENMVGVIRRGCHVVSMEQPPQIMEALQKRAAEMECSFHILDTARIKKVKYGVEQQRFTYGDYKDLMISQGGRYQILNCALAVEALNILKECGWRVTENAVRKGLMQTKLAGRFSVVAKKPLFIADGAHNADAAVQLAESLKLYFTNRKIIYIIGIARDKEYDKIIEATYKLAEHIITVTAPEDERAIPAYELAKEVSRNHGCVTAADSLEEAVELSYLLSDKDSVIAAFGSFSYLGRIIKIVENRDKIKRDFHGRSL